MIIDQFANYLQALPIPMLIVFLVCIIWIAIVVASFILR